MKLLPGVVAVCLGVGTFGVPVAPAVAHGGGLNAQGCHNNRKTGDYHCHRGGGGGSALSSSSGRKRSYGLSSSGGAFPNCAAARAAGAAPVREGQPGYSRRLDRDGDGVGCE
ncbi:excalibur calcium-binding domain-containing protein [Sphingomonas rhizophila]|uniref:Excalibur calcium-binding domain-containing protein n=1 Tax=Sphingomonas rhizophila TaxID=2071607 RepID=A0A7G9S912_9SPHN|nr:excalibur calcium-binding domain-containing protein [Sphingomonas rhizophila]QNN64337.1 excalibur calcium-binding domain-containing protein [Sphingomonas rhizophila]